MPVVSPDAGSALQPPLPSALVMRRRLARVESFVRLKGWLREVHWEWTGAEATFIRLTSRRRPRHVDCSALLILRPAPAVTRRRRVPSGLAIGFTLCVFASPARGQSEPASEASEATIDTGRGPIAGGTRFIGLGGAFVAIAQDTEGVAVNPAGTAVRMPYSWGRWDYGVGGDLAIGNWLPKNNFYNRPQAEGDLGSKTALFGSVSAQLNYEHFGVGISAEAQRNAATRSDQAVGISSNLTASFGVAHAGIAYGFFDGQLLLGAGPRFVGVSFDRRDDRPSVLSTAGVGYEAGFILKPVAAQYRIGAAVKSPVNARLPSDPGELQETVHVPWEVALGAAYQFGTPRLNPRFVTARDVARQKAHGREPTAAELEQVETELYERYERSERFHVLLSAELALLQGSRGHAGFEQYWSRGGGRALGGVIFSPRLGAESEVVPRILRLRVGSYYEPPLIEGVQGRLHATGGFDVRLFDWNVFGLFGRHNYWRLSLAADGAREYLNAVVGLGFWH